MAKCGSGLAQSVQALGLSATRDLCLYCFRDNNPKIADIFVRKGPFLKLYTGYIREFESMSATLVDAKKRYPEFEGVVRQFEVSMGWVCKTT